MNARRPYQRADDEIKAQRRKVAAARAAARGAVACDYCYATIDQIAGEQHRLRSEFYARQGLEVPA